MSATDTRHLIEQALERLYTEVPALKQLKLVIKLELQVRGDAPIWRIEVPGPKIERHPAGDARIDVIVQRQQFNALAEEGTLRDWERAYERGHVKVTGDSSVVKLLGGVVGRQLARTRG